QTKSNISENEGIGIDIRNSSNCNIYVYYLSNFKTGIRLGQYTPEWGGTGYNTISFATITDTNLGIELKIEGDIGNWVNQNRFQGGSIFCNNGILFTPVNNQSDPFNNNVF